MKTFVRLIRRYVLAAVGIVLLLVFLGLGLLVLLGWQETTHLPQRTYASSEIADAMVETPGGACPWRSAHPGRMDGRLCMGHGAGRHRSYPVELRFAGRAEPCLYHRRSGRVCPLVSGRLSGVLLGRGLWPVRHRTCQR